MKKNNLDNLTIREKEIYQLLMMKNSYAIVSKSLGITVGTVKQHVHNIYIKLGIKSRKALK